MGFGPWNHVGNLLQGVTRAATDTAAAPAKTMTSKPRLFTVSSEIDLYNDAALLPDQIYAIDYDPDSGKKADILKKLTIQNTGTGAEFEVTETAFRALLDSGLILFRNI